MCSSCFSFGVHSAAVKADKLPESAGKSVQEYSQFSPRHYIQEYYSEIGAENKFLLNFYHEVYKDVSPNSVLLEFGGGPTIYQLLSAGQKVKEIIFAEYLNVNREEIFKWIKNQPDAVRWDQYLDYVLKLNGKLANSENRREMQNAVKPKVTEIIECDAFLPDVLAGYRRKEFDIVSSGFCLECISSSEDIFIQFVEKIARLIKPEGTLVMTLLKNSHYYHIGNMIFPSFPVNENYIQSLLTKLGFSKLQIDSVAAEQDQGYEGLIALTAQR